MNTTHTIPEETNAGTQLTLTTTSDAIANGTDTNVATVRLALNVTPSPGSIINLALTGSARFNNNSQTISVTTGAQGTATAHFTNTVNETVSLRATYLGHIAYANSYFRAVPEYSSPSLTANIITNNAQANGNSQNIVEFIFRNQQTGAVVANHPLSISTNGQANYPPIITTNNQGIATLQISSNVVGNISVTAKSQTPPGQSVSIGLNFSSQYPILLGTRTLSLHGFIGTQTLLTGYELVRDHFYTIELDRSPSQIFNCTSNCSFSESEATLGCYFFDPNVTLLKNDLSEIILRASVNGRRAYSQRYYSFNNITQTVVSVWDNGPI